MDTLFITHLTEWNIAGEDLHSDHPEGEDVSRFRLCSRPLAFRDNDLWSQPPGHAEAPRGSCLIETVPGVDRFQPVVRQTGVTLLIDNDIGLSSHNKHDCPIEERGERDCSVVDKPRGQKVNLPLLNGHV